jgi:amino-acid N-acetyltransferase
MSSTISSLTRRTGVSSASEDDAREIAALLRRRAPSTIPVPVDRIRDQIDRYFVVREDGRVAGTASLHPINGSKVELRSVAVADGFGGRGFGSRLVRAAQHEAVRLGRDLVCATMSPEFFERLGFERTSLGVVPEKPERLRWPADRTRVALSWTPWASIGAPANDQIRTGLRRSA